MFLHEMKAIVLAMNAIRKINPKAKLVQTEDLGKTYSTRFLKYQAKFENERRWLPFDILCGRVKQGHPLWKYFKWLKIPEKYFNFFLDNPCPPDIIGADHYLTSERFLDQNLDLYPIEKHGSNHKHAYADVEALRVNHSHRCGLEILLEECWDRYQIPIAVTECHINGHADDQIRWFKEFWDACVRLRAKGVDIRAVTTWSMLGSFNWNNLLTSSDGIYEWGAFSLQDGIPEETELSNFLKALSKDPSHTHPALKHQGWWRKKNRFTYDYEEPLILSGDKK
jgi:dTDP-4-dehydrorhamnose reductase